MEYLYHAEWYESEDDEYSDSDDEFSDSDDDYSDNFEEGLLSRFIYAEKFLNRLKMKNSDGNFNKSECLSGDNLTCDPGKH